MGSLDKSARRLIESEGYGDAFGHSLGHGIGLDVHEMPSIKKGSKFRVKKNMVFTIEPGIYIAGWGGIRIEDTVVMKNGKIRVLSQAKKYPGS